MHASPSSFVPISASADRWLNVIEPTNQAPSAPGKPEQNSKRDNNQQGRHIVLLSTRLLTSTFYPTPLILTVNVIGHLLKMSIYSSFKINLNLKSLWSLDTQCP